MKYSFCHCSQAPNHLYPMGVAMRDRSVGFLSLIVMLKSPNSNDFNIFTELYNPNHNEFQNIFITPQILHAHLQSLCNTIPRQTLVNTGLVQVSRHLPFQDIYYKMETYNMLFLLDFLSLGIVFLQFTCVRYCYFILFYC